jgi:hypothetical protein
MDFRGINVLLVGQTAKSSFQLLQWLDNQGCQCHFASSCKDACEVISQTAFSLVISQFELPDRTAYPLLDRLVGSSTTLFFSKPVENGCWWLPMLVCGRECVGAYGLRPGEFLDTLGKTLAHNAREENASRA